MSKNLTFTDLFKQNTKFVKRDGNCFIWSAMEIYFNNLGDMADDHFKNVEIFRTALYMVAVEYFGQKYVDNNSDYANLRKNREWVEWTAGATALSLFMNQPVIIVSEFGTIRAENGNVEILDSGEKNKAILRGENTIVYHKNHYQPLTNDHSQRKKFVDELDTSIERAVQQSVVVQSASLAQSENHDQILFDAIDNAFTGNNRIEAMETVNEILKNVPADEKESMRSILLGGIIAEHELNEKKSVISKVTKRKKSVFDKVTDAKTKSKTNMPLFDENIPMQAI